MQCKNLVRARGFNVEWQILIVAIEAISKKRLDIWCAQPFLNATANGVIIHANQSMTTLILCVCNAAHHCLSIQSIDRSVDQSEQVYSCRWIHRTKFMGVHQPFDRFMMNTRLPFISWEKPDARVQLFFLFDKMNAVQKPIYIIADEFFAKISTINVFLWQMYDDAYSLKVSIRQNDDMIFLLLADTIGKFEIQLMLTHSSFVPN